MPAPEFRTQNHAVHVFKKENGMVPSHIVVTIIIVTTWHGRYRIATVAVCRGCPGINRDLGGTFDYHTALTHVYNLNLPTRCVVVLQSYSGSTEISIRKGNHISYLGTTISVHLLGSLSVPDGISDFCTSKSSSCQRDTSSFARTSDDISPDRSFVRSNVSSSSL